MTLSQMRSDVRFRVFGNSSDTTYSNTDINRNINNWYKTVLYWILSANGDWQVNGEYAVTDIVADQREYILPTDILKINELYIKSVSTGDYIKATQRDLRNVSIYPEDYRPNLPEFDLMDNSLFIYIPEENITEVDEGIKIYYQTKLTELSGDNDNPNLPEIFRKILCIGAALDYCEADEIRGKAKDLKNKIFGDPTVKTDKGLKDELMEFYASRSLTKPLTITPHRESFR